MTDEIKHMLKSHIDRFDEFHEEWTEHRKESKEATAKIAEVHNTVTAIAPQAIHLAQLPTIAGSLKALETSSAAHINSLIGQANSNEVSKTKLIEKMMMICLTTVIFLGVLLIVMLLRESNKNFNLGTTGVSLTSPESDNKKTP